MEWSNADRASTRPSRRVTVTQASTPCSRALEHPARRRTVEKELLAHPYMDRRDHVRLPAHDEAHVADQNLVEDRMDRGTVINPAIRQTSESGSIGARQLVHRRGRS